MYAVLDVTPYSPVKVNISFGKHTASIFTVERVNSARKSMEMEAKLSFETTVDFQRTTQRYIPEDRTLHNHRCDNLKPLYRYLLCRVQNISDNASSSDSDAGPYVTITMGKKIATPGIQLNTQPGGGGVLRSLACSGCDAAVAKIRLSELSLAFSADMNTTVY
jgi:hypothetical protein